MGPLSKNITRVKDGSFKKNTIESSSNDFERDLLKHLRLAVVFNRIVPWLLKTNPECYVAAQHCFLEERTSGYK